MGKGRTFIYENYIEVQESKKGVLEHIRFKNTENFNFAFDIVDKLAEEQTIEEEYEKNFSESLQMLEKVQAEQGLSDDEIDAAYELIVRIANDAVLGKFSEETVLMALKAVNHDADVEAAQNEGLIAGKNYKVEEKLRKPNRGDGTPNLQGSNNMPSGQQKKRKKSMFDLAMEAN